MAAAAAFYNFRPSPVICSSAQSKSDPIRNQKLTPSSPSNSWWTPLFGISSDPDYIQSSGNLKKDSGCQASGHLEGEMGRGPRSKFSLGCFTEERAKELRKKTIETSTFHDKMYHSVIASRLASDI